MPGLNAHLQSIRQSPTVAITDRIAALKAGGRRIIPLQVGDPDFATPQPVIDAALKAMQDGLTHYGPSRGLPELREAIASRMSREHGLDYDPGSEILVTHGGVHAYYAAMQAVLNPGDEVLIPDPDWATHANLVQMLRGVPVPVAASAEDGFIPPIRLWEQALTSKTRILVINYPSNPTGAYPGRKYLQELQDFASAHDLWVVSDEVYENLYYGGKPTCAASLDGARERTLLVNSFSKTYAMTGWRVGYLCAPAGVIENALKASQNSITCVAPFIQKAALFALADPQVQETASGMRATYARRRELVLEMSRSMGSRKIAVTPPMGAFYFFLDLRALGMPSLTFCERLLEDAGVGLVPGTAFGAQGEGFARMSIAASNEDVEAGFRSTLEWAESHK